MVKLVVDVVRGSAGRETVLLVFPLWDDAVAVSEDFLAGKPLM